ncbi:MAG: hypothetical protein HAW60_02175 [Bdellovibrionales bacterium]|nr:hypothetical protein [Bdellovibrionales bacterium]
MKKYTYYSTFFATTFFFVLNASAFFKASLDTKFNYYLSPVQFTNLSQTIVNIKPRIIYSSKKNNKSNYFYADIGALISSELLDSHPIIPELFFLYNLKSTKFKNKTLVFGRKKIKWSLLEENWKLGLLEPYFNANPLRPEKQGLFGIFYKQVTTNFLFRLFASPIFLPHQSGAVDLKNGNIKVHNRWNSFIYYDTAVGKKINYSLQDIDIYNFLQKWSLGLWAKKKIFNFGSRKNNQTMYLTASYFYKPYSDPYVYVNISDKAGDTTKPLDVLVKIKSVMHHIAFFEMQLKQKNFSEYISVAIDKPKKLSFLNNAKYSALVNKNILAFGFKYKNLFRGINFGGIYTKFNIIQQSVFSAEKDLRGIDDIYGYPYKTAFFVKANQKNILFASDEFFVKYTQILSSKVDILSIKYTKTLKNHILTLGFDILGHPFSEQVGGVFASNVSNDFIYIGWKYQL